MKNLKIRKKNQLRNPSLFPLLPGIQNRQLDWFNQNFKPQISSGLLSLNYFSLQLKQKTLFKTAISRN